MTLRHSLVLEMAAFLAWSSVPSRPSVLGAVAEADRAHVNGGIVSDGATVFDGDRFSTEEGGMLLLRGDASLLELAEKSVMVVRSKAGGAQGTTAELSEGTLVFSAGRTRALEIVVREARIYAINDARIMAQVSITGPKELQIYTRRGALYFSYRGETEKIDEGAAYRVILDPQGNDPGPRGAVKAGRERKSFLFLAITGAAAAGAVIAYDAHHHHKPPESPDRP